MKVTVTEAVVTLLSGGQGRHRDMREASCCGHGMRKARKINVYIVYPSFLLQDKVDSKKLCLTYSGKHNYEDANNYVDQQSDKL